MKRLLELLLGADVGGVTTGLLAAVGGAGRQTGVAAAADLLPPVVLLGQGHQSRLHNHLGGSCNTLLFTVVEKREILKLAKINKQLKSRENKHF